MNPYVIMTDTTADLPESYIQEHELAILSLNYTIEGKTYDRENPLDVGEFYAKMREGSMPTTSQVNPEQAKEAFSERKPYPGWMAFAFIASAALMILSLSR